MPESNLFKWCQYQPYIILCCIRWYLSYPLSDQQVVELFTERGLPVDHATVFRWVQYYTPPRTGQALSCFLACYQELLEGGRNLHVRNNVAKNQLDFSAIIQRKQSQPALLVLQHQESSSASLTSESCHGESSPPNPQGRGGI